jgi:hypothetical protein
METRSGDPCTHEILCQGDGAWRRVLKKRKRLKEQGKMQKAEA